MNLQTEISPDLWEAIVSQYENGNFSHAVLAAVEYLRDLIRIGADLDGDGQALIGQALGGTAPRLRVNRLETESEKDEQKGVEHLVRGIYLGIRNPRVHDRLTDSKQIADAIVVFVDYLAGVLGKAKGPFALDEWLARVLDPDFVNTERYAELMADEVPTRRLGDAILALYRNREEQGFPNIKLVFRRLIARIGEERAADLLSAISEELRTAQSDGAIIRTIDLLPKHLWPRIDEMARLRTENKLVKSIRSGRAHPSSGKSSSGALGTWARDLVPYFSLRSELYSALYEILRNDAEQQAYFASFFWSVLPNGSVEPPARLSRDRWTAAICDAVTSGQCTLVRDRLLETLWTFPDDWRTSIFERLKPLEQTDDAYYRRLQGFREEEIPF